MGVIVVGGTFSLLAAGGVFYAYTALLAQGEVVVYNDADAPLSVQVDGVVVSEIPPRRIDRIPVSQGAHVVTTGAIYLVQIDGFSPVLVPTGPSQCLAEVDVSHLYERPPRAFPLVVATWPGDAAVPISVHTQFLRSSLPDRIHEDYAPTLVVPVPCEGVEDVQAWIVANEPALF